MNRILVFLLVLTSSFSSCLGQWTSTAWYLNPQGDSIKGGRYLSEAWDGAIAIFGITGGLYDPGQGGFIGLLNSDNGNSLTYRYLPKETAMNYGSVKGVLPELNAFIFRQEKWDSSNSNFAEIKDDLISFDSGKIIGKLSPNVLRGRAFTQGSDSLIWTNLGEGHISLRDLYGNFVRALNEDSLPGGRLEHHYLQWLEEGDSLYGIYRPNMDSVRQVKVYAIHRATGQWGPIRQVECLRGEGIVGLSPKFRSLPYKISTEVELDSLAAMAEHSIQVHSLAGKELLRFKIRNPYILNNGNGGLFGGGNSFVYPIDIWKKNGYYLIRTKYRRQDLNWTKTYERIMLVDSTGFCSYDKLLDNGSSVFLISDLHFGDKGEVYVSYADWDRNEAGVFKVGKRGIHPFLRSIPLESENQPFVFTFYPNPVQDYLQLKAMLEFPEGSSLSLIALDGTVVHETSIIGSEPVLEIPASVRGGLYILQVSHPWLGLKYERILISR